MAWATAAASSGVLPSNSMAYASKSLSFFLVSSLEIIIINFQPFFQTPIVLHSFNGLRKTVHSHVPRSLLPRRSHASRRSFVVRAGKLSLAGNQAPDFEAEAFFDQEFIKFSHLAWVQTDRKSGGLGDLKYPLISDITKTISKAYDVLIADQGIALRGLFIIDKEGIIQHSTINNLAVGRGVAETPRTLRALQYVQENPDEVWPAGWKLGDGSSHEAESEA